MTIMTRDVSANDFPDLYAKFGIDINKLGVVMLDTEPLEPAALVPDGEADLYYAANKSRFWIKGEVAAHGAYVTLLYGLLQHGTKLREEISTVLDGWSLDYVQIGSIGAFESPYEDEPYACIVAHIVVTPELAEGHARLELLPHINTFLKYRPHLTLAYVKAEAKDKWLSALDGAWRNQTLNITNINVGEEHKNG